MWYQRIAPCQVIHLYLNIAQIFSSGWTGYIHLRKPKYRHLPWPPAKIDLIGNELKHTSKQQKQNPHGIMGLLTVQWKI